VLVPHRVEHNAPELSLPRCTGRMTSTNTSLKKPARPCVMQDLIWTSARHLFLQQNRSAGGTPASSMITPRNRMG